MRDSGQRKLTSSFQNHCTLHSVPVGAKPLSPRQCAPSRSIYLSRRLNSHWEILVTTHHLQKWESQLRLRWIKTVEYQRLKINLRINQTVKSEITKRFSIRMIRIDCSIIPQNDECQLLFYGIFSPVQIAQWLFFSCNALILRNLKRIHENRTFSRILFYCHFCEILQVDIFTQQKNL